MSRALEFIVLDAIRTGVVVVLAIVVRHFLGARLREISRRGDERAKEDQTGPWVRRG